MKRASFRTLANVSLWETIPRSLATTFITLLRSRRPYFFGGETLKDFAFACSSASAPARTRRSSLPPRSLAVSQGDASRSTRVARDDSSLGDSGSVGGLSPRGRGARGGSADARPDPRRASGRCRRPRACRAVPRRSEHADALRRSANAVGSGAARALMAAPDSRPGGFALRQLVDELGPAVPRRRGEARPTCRRRRASALRASSGSSPREEHEPPSRSASRSSSTA